MNTATCKNLLITFSMLVFVACGGGGGSNPPPGGGGTPPPSGNVVSVTTNAEWIACQDGTNGAWEVLSSTNTATTVFQCTIADPDGYYGIAVAITRPTDGGGQQRNVDILQGRLSEAVELNLVYEDLISNPTASITVSVSNANQGIVQQVAIDQHPPLSFNPSQTSQQVDIETGRWDIVGVEIDNQGDIVGNIYLQRAVDIADGNTYDVDFSQATIPSSALVPHAFVINASEGGTAFLLTENWTAVPAVDPVASTWSYLTQGLTDKDRYVFAAQHLQTGIAGEDRYYIWTRIAAAGSVTADPGDINVDLTAKSLLDITTLSLNGFSWGDYTPATGSPPLRAYGMVLGQNPDPGTTVTWDVTMTTGWLNGSTTYTLPDLVNDATSALPSEYRLDGALAADATASVIMFDVTPAEMARQLDPVGFSRLHLETSEWRESIVPQL